MYESISIKRDDETAKKLGIDELIKEVAADEARMEDIDLKLVKELKKGKKERKAEKKEAKKEK